MEWIKLLCLLCLSHLYTGSAQDNILDSGYPQSDINDNNIDHHAPLKTEYQENHKPIFQDCDKYSPQVEEEQKRDTFVIRVQAMDPDPPDSKGGRITYNIEQPPGTRANFWINSTTGEVFTSTTFDRDEPTLQKDLYLTIQAADDGHPQLSDICNFKIVVTDINDNTPSFDQQEYSTEVSEDLAENSEVLRVFAYDFDDGENSRLTYAFQSSNAGFDEFFRMDENTGVIYLQKKLLGKRGIKYASSVVVRDNGKKPLHATADISFTVVDSNKKPPTILNTYEAKITLKENENDFEKPLVTLEAESNIEDKSIAFELVKGKTSQTNKDQTFSLSPNGPTSAVIILSRFLDYETVTEYQLTVRAQNKDMLYTSVNIIVKVEDVNDEIPTFIELLKGSVVENDQVGAQAMTVRAIDKDGTSPNNLVVYELITHKDLFDIDPDTGLITAKTTFDREEEKLYYVTVQARDSAPSALFRDKTKTNSANQTFQISIEDQNDNGPKFTQPLYTVYNISEVADRQKDVIEVKAIDPDTASIITYSIIEGNIGDAFYIESQTGRIKVNNKLDFEKIESYNLTVAADDGIYNDTAAVIIQIQNENDEKPVFENYTKEIYFKEEETSTHCIIQLTAYDPDIKDRTADQKIIYRIGDKYKSFLSVTKDGCVTLIEKLDRDPPDGAAAYQAFIHADDNEGGPNALSSYAEINIILEDINDNAPFLNITEVVWYENEPPGRILILTATDNDGPNNGPPFTFQLSEMASSEISNNFRIQSGELYATVVFDREEKKFYDVPIQITDSGEPPQSDVSILRVIIGDRNDNAAQNGSSEIFVYKYQGFKVDTEIGRVYVNDPDDWDLPDKVFQFNGYPDSNFDLHDQGMIAMKKDATPGEYKLSFIVTETLPNATLNRVYADVTVTVKDIPEEAVRKSGSIRLSGTTIEEFVEKDPLTLQSKKDKLQNYIAKMLNTSVDNVDVFTVMTSPSNSTYIDVRFSAHGSPYYAPEKLNNKATEKQDTLEQELGVQIFMISINECLLGDVCVNSSCTNELQIKDEPAVVFTNKTSFVGVKAVAAAVCKCLPRIVHGCFNGGTAIEDGRCTCLEGFDGPNCETLGVSFTGDGWAMYPSFDSCASTVISLNVLPHTDDGLILYVGPLTERHAYLSEDFMSIELKDGYVVLKIDLGNGPEEIVSDYKRINDGAMHKIKVNYTMSDVQIEVDECPSDCLRWKNFRKTGLLQANGPLQVGGRSNIFTEEASKRVWPNPPSSLGFRGCISNLTYNSYVYHLGAPSDKYRAQEGTCNYGMFQAATFGIDSNFLVAILVCLAILLILLLAVVVHKRKQDNLGEKIIDDTTENIINYEDEGGGESDATFDLTVFPTVDEKPPIMRDNLYQQAADVPADIGSFLDDKKRACDKDTLPCDDVRHYAYEGDGNSSGSLSSLASCTDEGDLKFNYLSSFGPRFRKLADLYDDDASDDGSEHVNLII